VALAGNDSAAPQGSKQDKARDIAARGSEVLDELLENYFVISQGDCHCIVLICDRNCSNSHSASSARARASFSSSGSDSAARDFISAHNWFAAFLSKAASKRWGISSADSSQSFRDSNAVAIRYRDWRSSSVTSTLYFLSQS